jgi:HK97 family phage portal protein
LKHSIRPSGALVFQDGSGYLTDEQFERLQQQFYENFSGANNSGKPLILEGGLKWQEMHAAERFEKFIELKDSTARDIAIAFNIPPQLLGINGDNTYSNMQEARLALWEENIIPLLDKYADALSSWLSYWYQETLLVNFDQEAISMLTERRESLWSKIAQADFMTINEKRALVGLNPIQGGDVLFNQSDKREKSLD